jgi:hypothetical protein
MTLQFKGFFTGFVLFVLAAGFTSLGFLSFINRQPESATPDFISETTYSMIGGSISIFVGGAFLAAAILSAGTLLRRRRLVTLSTAMTVPVRRIESARKTLSNR